MNHDRSAHAMIGIGNRLGRRFMWSSIGIFAATAIMISLLAQQMFISSKDLGVLMWILIPAGFFAAVSAYFMSRPIAMDACKLSEAAVRIGDGDLAARTGIVRFDELGDAAEQFDLMADRLEAVETERSLMLSSISHDLRTPLAALRASVEAIRDGVAGDPDAHLSGMEAQVRALSHLVDDLSLHTRLASGTLDTTFHRLDLTEVADEVIEVMRPIADKATVRLEMIASDHVVIDGDGGQLSRVIRNLIENAIRHSPAAGAVCVEVYAVDQEAVVRVSDEGPGFPEGLRAFEPFTRADPARDVRTGTAGLGLAIAKGIVNNHGGSITIVDSPLRAGSGAVEFRLALAPRERSGDPAVESGV